MSADEFTEEAARANRYRGETVPFTKEAVMAYLDGAIRFWRVELNKRVADAAASSESVLIAECAIDGFQSVRTSLFGETLP